jgi:hypothetical protein
VTHTVRITALMSAAALTAGCDRVCKRVVPIATATTADWAYVDNAWGATKLKSAAATDRDLTLTLTLFVHPPTHVDSGICDRGVHARQEGSRIAVAIDRSLCGDGPHPLTATIAKPPEGTYDVVYDDASAGYPRIGRLTIGPTVVTVAPP